MAVTKKARTKLALKQPRNLCEKLQRIHGHSTTSSNIASGSKGKGNISSAQLSYPPSPTNTASFPAKTISPYGLVIGVNSDFICKYN